MHRVNCIEVELHSSDPALARALSERVGRMHRERIAPLLDRVCTELSGNEAEDRIDRLELDLGTVAADDLEDTFVARLEPALRAALAKALWRTSDLRARAPLELLEIFALTGSLPWWAPHGREVVARHFARAAVEASADLAALLDRIARDPGALDRIARMCGDHELIGNPSAARRGNRDAPGRLEALDGRRTPMLDTDPSDGAQLTQPSGGDAMAQPPSAKSRPTGDALRRQPLADPEVLDERHAGAPDRAVEDPAAADPALLDDATRLDEQRRLARPVLAALSAVAPRAANGTPRLPPVPAFPAAIRAARRGALARLDELYVADAGLVILWPFLERFFVRTGVLGDDRRFLDEVAQLQAVALVEALATADAAPLEFQLPLAKLLCGRPLESDFVLERLLAPEQLAEGDRLLAAVIGRAPVPTELSIPSFRADFLVRPGALGTRDGAWLLQVERRPHDALLDRFPWSWGWIKLPWMPEPLRVEW
jgi:hypothetical protein